MGLRQRGVKQMANRLLDTPALDKLTYVLVQSEHELLQAAQALDDAHDNDNIRTVPAVEERQQALKELLRALVTESFDDAWMAEIAPELLDNPERAEQYLGIDGDEWEAQIGRWADSYRDQGASGTDDQLAAYHVRQTFGVEFETFEQRVVGWSQGAEAERLFADNFRACVAAMREATEAVEEHDG